MSKNEPYNGETLFDLELSGKLTLFAKRLANELKIFAPDEVDHWEQFEDKADVNIWQDPDERILRAAAYPLCTQTHNGEEYVTTDTSKWQSLFEVRNTATDYYQDRPGYEFTI